MAGRVLLCIETASEAARYRDALLLAGMPVDRLTVLTPEPGNGDPAPRYGEAYELAAGAAGLVLGGGPDIHPRHFGEAPLDDANLRIVEPLDELELALLGGARASRTPVWAICRGMQTANVYLGGTLFQDLALQLPGVGRHDVEEPLDHPAHGLERIASGSRFCDALARHAAPVNSRHHQAVKELAPGLREVAWSPDGVLESCEWCTEEWWLKGVQWHPENLTAMPYQLALWREFLDECGIATR